jgi:secreted Zn-dependent insulinase-like peptidase
VLRALLDYSPHLTPQRLSLQLEKLCKSYRNASLLAGRAAAVAREVYVLPHQADKATRLEALQRLSQSSSTAGTDAMDIEEVMKVLKSHMQRMRQACQCECLVLGNIAKETAVCFGETVAGLVLGVQSAADQEVSDSSEGFRAVPPVFIFTPPKASGVEDIVTLQVSPRSDKEKNVCVEVYFDIGDFSVETLAALRLVEIALEEPCFDHLRTKQQVQFLIACIHTCDSDSTNSYPGMQYYVLFIYASLNPS